MALEQELKAQFDQLASNLNFVVSDEKRDLLIRFVLLLHKWNKAYNLSSVRDPKEMLVKHIFDSIVVAPYLKGTYIADVGTGPGLPGIPLAIMCPDMQFTLIDSLGKRIRFIKQAIFDLKLDNVHPVLDRVENVVAKPPFDIILSRAFASLSDMTTWCQHLSDDKGLFLALKGQLHDNELKEIPDNISIIDCVPLCVPSLSGERHLISLKKQY